MTIPTRKEIEDQQKTQPKDQWGVPIPTRQQIEARQIEDRTIAETKARDKEGGPIAGHDFKEEAAEKSRSRRR